MTSFPHIIPVNCIQPNGWVYTRMANLLNGWFRKIPELVPELFSPDLYGADRIGNESPIPKLGNLKAGDAPGEAQYRWWNSETQSNWLDGFVRLAWYSQNNEAISQARNRIEALIKTQDEDGYIGIYQQDLRYRFEGENGELWAKATLFRALTFWVEVSGDTVVFQALVRGVDNLMAAYPIDQSHPFKSNPGFNGGMSHGLCITDVLEWLYQKSGNAYYLDYARFLYEDYSRQWQSESDAQFKNASNPEILLQGHGVHAFEHLRTLLVASSSNEKYSAAARTYGTKLLQSLTPAGGPIGDEWIKGRMPQPRHTGYEMCSIQEWIHSIHQWMLDTQDLTLADVAENTFYNAGFGAFHPKEPGIAYLRTDDSFIMDGSRNGEIEPNRKQTRYKFSVVHQDVAACCAPNAGRLIPYFLQYAVLFWSENELRLVHFLPLTIDTIWNNQPVKFRIETNYPYEEEVLIYAEKPWPKGLKLSVRIPGWLTHNQSLTISSEGEIKHAEGLITINSLAEEQPIRISWKNKVKVESDSMGTRIRLGPWLLAAALSHKTTYGRNYGNCFRDIYAQSEPLIEHGEDPIWHWVPQPEPEARKDGVTVNLYHRISGKIEAVPLVPMHQAVIRQVNFAEKPHS